MRRFFDRPDTKWRSLNNCLHVYAVPSEDAALRDDFVAMATALAHIPELGHQAVEHVHMTVQRLDAFVDDVAPDVITALVEGLDRTARAAEPFELGFDAPVVTSHAIQAIAPQNSAWDLLTEGVRSAVRIAGLGAALTPPPPLPHYTLAYGIAEIPDDEIAPSLQATGRPTTAVVDTISLVSVGQDPVEGAFRFGVLREFSLGR